MLEIFGTNGYKSCWIVNHTGTDEDERECGGSSSVHCGANALHAVVASSRVQLALLSDSPQVPQLRSAP